MTTIGTLPSEILWCPAVDPMNGYCVANVTVTKPMVTLDNTLLAFDVIPPI
jgi:hypothetical protein